jgi:hypothetical protein
MFCNFIISQYLNNKKKLIILLHKYKRVTTKNMLSLKAKAILSQTNANNKHKTVNFDIPNSDD